MKVHTHYLNAVILFALAFLLAAATGPVAAQQPGPPDSVEAGIPPQVHQLIDLLDDPAVRTWMDQQRAARNPHQPTPVDPQATLSTSTAARVALVRQHLQSLIAALPNLPGEFRQTSSVLLGELRDWGLITVVLLTTGFALLGFCLEWLFWRATARVRTRLHDNRLDTVPQRLRGATTRFAIGLGQVIAFALGSIGAFLPFEWPPLLRNIVLGYLVAFLFLRLSLVIGRFLLSPEVERFRIIPVTTPQAHFWYLRLASFVGWFAFGYITVEQFSLLGASREARQILAYILGLGLLGIGLESIWRSPRVSGDPPSRISTWLLSAYFAVLWLLWVAGAMPLFWLVTVAVALPMAIRLTQRSVNHILRPPTVADPPPDPSSTPATAPPSLLAVGLERGARATMIIAAAILLSYVWNIDLIELSGRNTLPTRLLRGALSAIVIVLIADFAWHLIRAAIDRKLTQTLDPDPNSEQARRQSRLRTLLPILRSMLLIVLIVMAGLMTLSSMGIEIGPLIAGAGVIGVAIGFGAQTLVKDIISGMFYLLDDAFRIGEYIQSGSYKGTVESFSLRSIKLRHHRGPLYTVPFGSLGAVQNMSRDWVIDKLTVSVTYDTDLAAVKKIIKRVGAELAADAEFAPQIIETLKMQGVEEFGEFAVQIRMKMMTKPGEQFVIRRRAYALIKSAFENNGIKFAFPTVHVAGGPTNDSPAVQAAVGHKGLELVKPPPAPPPA
jgi:moderate conductance mechanosensitive channel